MKKPIDVRALLTMLLPLLTVFLLMTLLAGCSGRVGIGIDAACGQWDTLSASRFDSMSTVAEIYQNNVKREAFCRGV